MIVKTLFQFEGRFALGEVEVKTLPGIPILHVVGLPDTHIKECGLRLKSALKSCGFQWPQGNQIVVNLRPSYFRKSSSGADLAIALGFLALTGQLSDSVRAKLEGCVVYGEVGLDGKVFAPPDLPSAIRGSKLPLLTGAASERIRDGAWLELASLSDTEIKAVSRHFDWDRFWVRPSFGELEFHREAAHGLALAAVGGLNVLLAGSQGSGKTTWARALYALSTPPEIERMCELEDMFGDEVLDSRWRPFESPHHSITAQAMIGGGGAPIFPGVISRAHGGFLVMDEFLQYHPMVLEALREPVESGYIVHARRGDRLRFPAQFQLIATSNLCPCGKLNPVLNATIHGDCRMRLNRCASVLRRLSGPIMDRFDFLQVTNTWLHSGERIQWSKIRETVDAARAFRQKRGPSKDLLPDWIRDLGHSHRRNQSLLRVARVLADLRESPAIESTDFQQAYERVITPMEALRQYFA